MHRLTRAALDSPRATLVAVAVVTVLVGAGALRLDTDAGYRAYVGNDHPSVRQLDDFVARFGGGLPVAAVWSCRETDACQDVFDPASLAMAFSVAREVEVLPGVAAVESPATSALLVPAPEGFQVRRATVSGTPASDVSALRDRARLDPLWVGHLISPDARVGAIVVELDSSDCEVTGPVLQGLRDALAPYESEGFEFHLVGDPVAFFVAGADLQADSLRLVPVIAILIAGTILALFGSGQAVWVSLAPVGVAVVWAFGTMGWLGWPQTAVTQALAPFVLVVGVCNAIHLLSRYAGDPQSRSVDPEQRRAAVVRVSRDVGGACAVASATTAGGFASFTTSGAVSFVHFGAISALGVMSALLLSFSLLPILLVGSGPLRGRTPSRVSAWDGVLAAVARGAQRRAGLILALTAVGGVACGFGIVQLRAEVDVYHMFGERTRVVRWIRFVEENLRRAFTLEVSVGIPEGRSVEEPEILDEVQRLAAFLSGVEGLDKPRSILDPLTWLNRLLHGDDPSQQRPAESAEGNAELLLLLSMQHPGATDRWLSLDRSRLRISVTAAAGSYSQGADIVASVRRYLGSELPPDWDAEVTGPIRVYTDMVHEVQTTQLRSFATAALVVFTLVTVFLHSLPWALAAMVPTLIPVLATLGVMGAWGIYLDMGTAMVAAVVLGIAIDDTVHLLVQYQRRRDAGARPARAIQEAVRHVGRAVVTTSIALSLGFFVLTLSSWESVASFGFLSGVAILGAMVADLVVLPALVAAVTSPRLRRAPDVSSCVARR